MRNKRFFAVLCCLLAVCLLGAPSAAAEGGSLSPRQALDEIIEYRLNVSGAGDVQAYIDGPLAACVGTGGEEIILALAQSGEEYDFTAFNAALLGWLNENRVPSASTRQKYALTLMAGRCGSGYIDGVLADSIGQMGIMSRVYGLHLLNNGGQSDSFTAASVTADLLAAQLPDGGWALFGQNSDVDVTAMVIQALAVHYGSIDGVKAAVDKAVAMLSERQLPGGGYLAFGEENTESAAQVITALSALGVDCRTDERFIKEGGSLYDALLSGRLPDGSFAHTRGGEYSAIATDQAMCAFTAILRMEQGKAGLFSLDGGSDCTPAGIVYSPAEPQEETGAESGGESSGGKVWAVVIIVLLAAAVCAALWLSGRRSRKNFAAVAVMALLAAAVALFADIQTPDSYYGQQPEKENAIGTVTLSVDCSAVADRGAEHIPHDGVILPPTELELCEGETVYDLLIQCARAGRIPVESGSTSYIKAIGGIREQDFGPLSGWVYLVNGQSPSVGCDSFRLSPGDRVEWVYSLELGSDIGNKE